MSIEEMQEAIIKEGWQWQEHVFNDGDYRDCTISATDDKSPHAFTHEARDGLLGKVGWGRFPRQKAWEMAYNYIVLKRRNT